MAKDLNYLANVMPKYGEALQKDVNVLTGEIVIGVVASVAKRTPVDVATARSNWTVTDAPGYTGTRSAFAPFPSRWKPPYGPGGSLSETRNQAGAVWSASAIVGKRQPEQSLYISNNLPYIKRLNEGWSKQAPAGFIQAGITEGINTAVQGFKFKNMENVK